MDTKFPSAVAALRPPVSIGTGANVGLAAKEPASRTKQISARLREITEINWPARPNVVVPGVDDADEEEDISPPGPPFQWGRAEGGEGVFSRDRQAQPGGAAPPASASSSSRALATVGSSLGVVVKAWNEWGRDFTAEISSGILELAGIPALFVPSRGDTRPPATTSTAVLLRYMAGNHLRAVVDNYLLAPVHDPIYLLALSREEVVESISRSGVLGIVSTLRVYGSLFLGGAAVLFNLASAGPAGLVPAVGFVGAVIASVSYLRNNKGQIARSARLFFAFSQSVAIAYALQTFSGISAALTPTWTGSAGAIALLAGAFALDRPGGATRDALLVVYELLGVGSAVWIGAAQIKLYTVLAKMVLMVGVKLFTGLAVTFLTWTAYRITDWDTVFRSIKRGVVFWWKILLASSIVVLTVAVSGYALYSVASWAEQLVNNETARTFPLAAVAEPGEIPKDLFVFSTEANVTEIVKPDILDGLYSVYGEQVGKFSEAGEQLELATEASAAFKACISGLDPARLACEERALWAKFMVSDKACKEKAADKCQALDDASSRYNETEIEQTIRRTADILTALEDVILRRKPGEAAEKLLGLKVIGETDLPFRASRRGVQELLENELYFQPPGFWDMTRNFAASAASTGGGLGGLALGWLWTSFKGTAFWVKTVDLARAPFFSGDISVSGVIAAGLLYTKIVSTEIQYALRALRFLGRVAALLTNAFGISSVAPIASEIVHLVALLWATSSVLASPGKTLAGFIITPLYQPFKISRYLLTKIIPEIASAIFTYAADQGPSVALVARRDRPPSTATSARQPRAASGRPSTPPSPPFAPQAEPRQRPRLSILGRPETPPPDPRLPWDAPRRPSTRPGPFFTAQAATEQKRRPPGRLSAAPRQPEPLSAVPSLPFFTSPQTPPASPPSQRFDRDALRAASKVLDSLG